MKIALVIISCIVIMSCQSAEGKKASEDARKAEKEYEDFKKKNDEYQKCLDYQLKIARKGYSVEVAARMTDSITAINGTPCHCVDSLQPVRAK